MRIGAHIIPDIVSGFKKIKGCPELIKAFIETMQVGIIKC